MAGVARRIAEAEAALATLDEAAANRVTAQFRTWRDIRDGLAQIMPITSRQF
jgi:hypothetical protein